MSHSQSDSFFCVRIKRITQLQQETFLSSESYVRVRQLFSCPIFEVFVSRHDSKIRERSVRRVMEQSRDRKGTSGTSHLLCKKHFPCSFSHHGMSSSPVKRDSISTECLYLELKRRLRFGQSSVLGSVKINLTRLRGYMGIKDSAVLKDKVILM